MNDIRIPTTDTEQFCKVIVGLASEGATFSATITCGEWVIEIKGF